MRTVNTGPVEVATDGLKVWVNCPQGCLARLCNVSMEIFPAGLPRTPAPFLAYERTQDGTWERFRAAVLLHHKVEVPLDFIPDWYPALVKR